MEEFNVDFIEGLQDNEDQGETEGAVSLSSLLEQVQGNATADKKPAATETDAKKADPRNGDATRGKTSADVEKIENQTDFNRVLRGRLAEERERVERRLKSDEAYQIGQRVLQEIMQRDGITAKEAARKYIDERTEQLADLYDKNPKEYIKAQLKNQFGQREEAPPKQVYDDADDTTDPKAAGRLLTRMEEDGELPDGFSQESIDRAFVEDVKAFGVRRALSLWERENSGAPRSTKRSAVPSREDIASDLQKRQKLASPMRVSGGDAQPKAIDYNALTKEQFKALDAEIERGLKQGKKFAP